MNDEVDGDKALILDTMFDSGTLHTLRAEVQAGASRVGFPRHRVEDMVLAVHELAANAVRHGAGAGRLRIWNLAGALHCRVDDGAPAFDDAAALEADLDDAKAAETQDPSGPSVASRWAAPGHGLWVVRQVADRFQIRSSARGTTVTVIFGPPAGGAVPCL